MIDYPAKLNTLFDLLNSLNIKPIIVGGYVRDKLLHRASKDVDIELYGLRDLEELENILKDFGDINSVGKSFGVCKLNFDGLDIDFSLPREDSKVSSGHRGFNIKTDAFLDFKTATSRRDFRMNAIGYDVLEKKILDPFHGQKDIKEKRISAVDESKFIEDPLRVLRAVQFASRFEFRLDEKLFTLCKKMVAEKSLDELPKERIYEEIKKLLLKSQKPSIGFKLLKELKSSLYFNEFENILDTLDYMAQKKQEDTDNKLTLMLTILSYSLSEKDASSFLNSLTEEKKLHKEALSLLQQKNIFTLHKITDYDLYKLALTVKINDFLSLMDAITLGKEKKKILLIKRRAKELNILYTQAKAIIQGRDLIKLGFKPSSQFSIMLDKIYDAQIHSEFITYTDGIKWIKTHLS